jgi:hypothetical protein
LYPILDPPTVIALIVKRPIPSTLSPISLEP